MVLNKVKMGDTKETSMWCNKGLKGKGNKSNYAK
jgi:hypothetical protein